MDISHQFRAACLDYRYLLDRGYPDQGVLKLVGDRYRLSRVERAMLLRGVFSQADSVSFAERRLRGRPVPEPLWIDGFNVLFTIANYLAGRPLVLATDGFVRDIGGTHNRLPLDGRLDRVVIALIAAVREIGVERCEVLFDRPVAWSIEHARHLADCAPEFSCRAIDRVDETLIVTGRGSLATSDTGIISRTGLPVFDLAGLALRGSFAPQFIDLQAIFAQNAQWSRTDHGMESQSYPREEQGSRAPTENGDQAGGPL